MNWFDIFVVILLLRTGYIGLKNGLAVEIYKTAGLGFSGLVSFYFYKGVVSFINQYTITTLSDNQFYIISFIVLLLTGLLACKFIFMFLQKVVRLSFAKNFDTAAGMFLGLARGAAAACLVFMLLNWSAVDYIKRSPFQGLAAIFVLSLTFFVATLVSILVYSSTQLLSYFETRPQVIAFLKEDTTQEQIDELMGRLSGDPRIANLNFVFEILRHLRFKIFVF